jgi:hypothetical protein
MTDQQKFDFMGYEGEAYATLQDAKRNAQKVQQQASEPIKQTPSIPQRIKGVYNNIRNYISKFLGKKDS